MLDDLPRGGEECGGLNLDYFIFNDFSYLQGAFSRLELCRGTFCFPPRSLPLFLRQLLDPILSSRLEIEVTKDRYEELGK